jgi:hypothetical protein
MSDIKNPMLSDNEKPYNPVSNPAHYTACGISPLEFFDAQFGTEGIKGFCIGNALKYIGRHDKKGKPLEDLEKASWYLNYYIEALKIEEKKKNG